MHAEVLPALLSTMRLPEMDAEERELLQNHQTAVASEGLPALYERLGVSALLPSWAAIFRTGG